jgi:nucleotide-binding universal stress UspA family protein
MFPPRIVLVPTDFSDHARAAVHLASTIARECKAQVVVAHVDPPPLVHGEAVDRRTPDYQASLRALIEGIRLPDASVPVERHLLEGAPADEIVRLAKDKHCDLIVMGTHGRTGLMRAMIGSVAEQVIRTAPCPVLTVRFPQAGGP